MTQAIMRSMRSTMTGNASARLLFWGAGAAFSILIAAGVYAMAARTVEDDARQRFARALGVLHRLGGRERREGQGFAKRRQDGAAVFDETGQ